jgi:hypothetical protein
MNAALSLLRAARHYRAWCKSFERRTRRVRAIKARGVRLLVGGKLAAYLTLPDVDVWIGPGSLDAPPALVREAVEPLVLHVQESKRRRGAG